MEQVGLYLFFRVRSVKLAWLIDLNPVCVRPTTCFRTARSRLSPTRSSTCICIVSDFSFSLFLSANLEFFFVKLLLWPFFVLLSSLWWSCTCTDPLEFLMKLSWSSSWASPVDVVWLEDEPRIFCVNLFFVLLSSLIVLVFVVEYTTLL